MAEILISIIVPIYNVEKYLGKCINSIVNQTYRNLQIILVDDGSDDDSLRICNEFANIDERILVVHKSNGGTVSARKYGVEYVKGEYVLSVDADDWIEENRVYHMVEEIKKNQADMIYLASYYKEFGSQNTQYMVWNEEEIFSGNQIQDFFVPRIMSVNEFFCPNVNLALWSWGIRSDIYKKNQRHVIDQIALGEEIPCILMCLMESQTVSVINEGSYHYVQRGTSITNMITQNSFDTILGWSKQLRTFLIRYNLMKKCKYIYKHYYISYLLTSNYEFLFTKYKMFLFPYSEVKKGSKVIVYGAGKFGKSLVNTLSKYRMEYEIVLWVDRESNSKMGKMKVFEIKHIKNVDFDYVVVAIINYKLAHQIKSDLLQMGIENKKIATIDTKIINNVNIEDIENYD